MTTATTPPSLSSSGPTDSCFCLSVSPSFLLALFRGHLSRIPPWSAPLSYLSDSSLVSQWAKKSAFNALDTGDACSIPGSGRSPGGGHGNPLQYSCLENPMDRGAWQAIVHGFAESWTRLKQLSTCALWSLPDFPNPAVGVHHSTLAQFCKAFWERPWFDSLSIP